MISCIFILCDVSGILLYGVSVDVKLYYMVFVFVLFNLEVNV